MEAATSTGAAKRPPPLPWLDKLVREPFFLLHLLAFFSYFAVRSSSLHHAFLLRREIQALLAFLVLALVKAVKSESQEAYIADILFYGKVFLFALVLLIDQHLAVCYLIGFLVIFVVAQQPACDKLGDSFKLTPLQLETLFSEAGTSRFWLVEFRNQISSRCIRFSRLLPELSVTYSNKNISFGIIDLGHFPNCAGKFGISLEGALGSGQPQPIYILFDRGSEVSRFPEHGDDSIIQSPNLTKRGLCRHFGLDFRLIEYFAGY